MRWILALSLVILAGCSTSEKYDLNTAEGLFKSAEILEKDERYEEAITRFADVKNKFPYNKLAAEAELKIADVHFKKEAYIESQTLYQAFVDLHPKHPKVDYALYQSGLSYYNQLPSTIDRDLTSGVKAKEVFQNLLKTNTGSSYAKDTREKIAVINTKLAEKELYIADFYRKRKIYDSALSRYQQVSFILDSGELVDRARAQAEFCRAELKKIADNEKGN